jgi:hypothetical protein
MTMHLKKAGLAGAALAILLSVPAYAQDKGTVCRLLTSGGKATASVPPSANYVPGVDVHGKPVVGADVNAAPASIIAPDKIRIPVTISVLQGLQLPPGTKLDADVGMVEVFMNGKVMYNGQDITAQTYAACGMQAPEAVKEPQPVVPAQQQVQTLPTVTQTQKAPVAPPPAVTLNQRSPLKDYELPKEGDVIYGEGH